MKGQPLTRVERDCLNYSVQVSISAEDWKVKINQVLGVILLSIQQSFGNIRLISYFSCLVAKSWFHFTWPWSSESDNGNYLHYRKMPCHQSKHSNTESAIDRSALLRYLVDTKVEKQSSLIGHSSSFPVIRFMSLTGSLFFFFFLQLSDLFLSPSKSKEEA